MKVVFDNLANFLSISPNQTPGFCRLFAWSQLEFSAVPVSSHPILSPIYVYSVQCTCSHTHMHSTVCDQLCCDPVNIRLQLYTCFLTMGSKHASSKILNDIGRNSLLENRKKIAKFLMRTFTCRSTFLYAHDIAPPSACVT